MTETKQQEATFVNRVPGRFNPITFLPRKVSRFSPLNRYYIIIDEVFFKIFFGNYCIPKKIIT